MKFLCISCDEQMEFSERQVPGDGTLAASFQCPGCGHRVAMLTNPMETRLVSSLGVEIGGETVPAEPLRSLLSGVESRGPVRWSVDAVERLNGVPSFVRGMVKKIYNEYARDHGIDEVTPSVMDRARTDLGLEGM